MTTKYEYWIQTNKEGDPYILLRTTPPGVGDFAEVWYQDEWLPTRTTQAEMSGLGGSASYRVIPKSSVERLLPGFLKTLSNHDD